MRLLPIHLIQPGAILASNVYAKGRTLFRRGHKLSQRDLRQLGDAGLVSLHILNHEEDGSRAHGIISEETRTKAIETVYKVFNDFENLNMRHYEAIRTTADTIVDEVAACGDVKILTHELRTHDDYTYRHCVNVTVITVAMASLMQFESADLKLLATGALMHDIGKMKIPDSILKKDTLLNDQERDYVNQHPIFGFDLLNERTQSSPKVWAIARQHHEMLDGSGYPEGLKREQIHPWVYIVSVADYWDAMRSDRPYRAGMPADVVLSIINSESSEGKFDPEVLEVLNRITIPYPIGTNVRLTNGMSAVVMKQNYDMFDSPVIQVVKGEKGQDMDPAKPMVVDLRDTPDVKIDESLF